MVCTHFVANRDIFLGHIKGIFNFGGTSWLKSFFKSEPTQYNQRDSENTKFENDGAMNVPFTSQLPWLRTIIYVSSALYHQQMFRGFRSICVWNRKYPSE